MGQLKPKCLLWQYGSKPSYLHLMLPCGLLTAERSACYPCELGGSSLQAHGDPDILFLPRETLVPTFSWSSCFSLLASSSCAWRSFI